MFGFVLPYKSAAAFLTPLGMENLNWKTFPTYVSMDQTT